ncbi:tRNA (adenosine(37)-N6)-threonylcarbamoyltransferase complex dimerization subunit type 1 TsaB [Duganella phyllosphaerae]|uniref:tRNA threonylcarbamoyladenosine biosynthesis protein TsaB n=1 Tax=Duganella phyllosphaerae TaxID=762836 RepID=A0A1E7W8N8_9BURK|nr:tRNA (adenosine(37)-N6)-threonylcarbamoyltransferase complex dimerization subunit type 1 TsaB [Duganella phyllosphaerae]OEZ92632.1 tRNA threonylcarbamoyladenosine biosynthesis protein TsaB [Duganella phyllosphaerae]
MPTISTPPTTIVAIETSSEAASVALLRGDTVISRASSGVRTHSQSVLPMIQELLAEAGISLKDCSAIAFGAGPGSFTGVRTACGVAQGLAFGANLPVVPVVTLDAMALACHQRHGAADVVAVLDARMGEVYWAQYRFDGAAVGAPQLVQPAVLSAPDAVQAHGAPVFCGNGLSAYAEAFAGVAEVYADVMPHAEQIAQLASLALAAGRTVTAAEAQPLYLRNKVAYTQAERRDINAEKADKADKAAKAAGGA